MRYLALVWFAVFCAGLSGCGKTQPKVKVTGQLVKGNQPFKLGAKVMSQMMFHPYDDLKEGRPFTPFPAMLHEDGSFEVAEIPVGKYLITMEAFSMEEGVDRFRGAFTKEKSTIVQEITGPEPIQIDIGKPPS